MKPVALTTFYFFIPPASGKTSELLMAAVPARIQVQRSLESRDPPNEKTQKDSHDRESTYRHLGTLIGLLRKDGFRVLGPTSTGSCGRVRRDPFVRGPAIGWSGRADERFIQAEPDRGQSLVRLCGRPALLGSNSFFRPNHRWLRSHRSNGSDGTARLAEDPRLRRWRSSASGRASSIAISDPGPCFHRRAFRRPLVQSSSGETSSSLSLNARIPCGTCFCASMKTGPRATKGFDLALTETSSGFISCRSRFTAGKRMLNRLPGAPAEPKETQEAEELLSAAAAAMGRTLETEGFNSCSTQTCPTRVGTWSAANVSRAPIAPWSAPRASAPRSRTDPI